MIEQKKVSFLLVGTAILFCFLPNIQVIWRFLPFFKLGSALFYLSLSFLLFLFLQNQKIFNKSNLAWVLPLSFLVFATALHVFALSILDPVGMGATDSDNDDAFILAVQSFFNYGDLYGARPYTGNGVSAGPLWLILNAPFAYFGYPAFLFLNPAWMGISFMILFSFLKEKILLTPFVLWVSSQLYFWKLLLSGYDGIAIGFLLAVLPFLVRDPHKKIVSWKFLATMILIAAVGTSRAVFLVLPFILYLCFPSANQHNKRSGQNLLLFLGSLFLIALSHMGFSFYSEGPYAPFEVVFKSELTAYLPQLSILGLVIFLLARKIIPYFSNQFTFRYALYCSFWTIAFVVIAAENLVAKDLVLRDWTGATWLFFYLPALSLCLFTLNLPKTKKQVF